MLKHIKSVPNYLSPYKVVSNNQKQKGEPQNVSRTTTSLSYMAIYRNKRDCYCTSRMAKDGRIANATSSFYFHHKKVQRKHKKITKKYKKIIKTIDKLHKKVYNIIIKIIEGYATPYKKENAI